MLWVKRLGFPNSFFSRNTGKTSRYYELLKNQLKDGNVTIAHPQIPGGMFIKQGIYSVPQLKRMVEDVIHNETRHPRLSQTGVRTTLEKGGDDVLELLRKIPILQRKQDVTILGKTFHVNFDKMIISRGTQTIVSNHIIDPKMLLGYDVCIKCYIFSHLFYGNLVSNVILRGEAAFEEAKMEFTQHFNEAHPDLCKQKLEQKQNVRAFHKVGEETRNSICGTSVFNAVMIDDLSERDTTRLREALGGGDTYTSSIRSWVTRNDSN